MNNDCIFCKIIAGDIPAEIITQNNDVIVIKDIAPKAPTHYLIIPKKHIKDIASLTADDDKIAASMVAMAQHIAGDLNDGQDFRLIMNNGKSVGQSVFHLHCHYLAGKKMTDL